MSRARIEFDPAVTSAPALASAIRAAGYSVPDEPASVALAKQAVSAEMDDWRGRATVALALAAPCILIGMAHGAAWTHHPVARAAQAVLATLIVFGPGRAFFGAAWHRARHRTTDMNTLVALGAGAAWLVSIVAYTNAPSGHTSLYFEAAAAIIAFVALGKALESRARGKVVSLADALATLVPRQATRRDSEGTASVLSDDVRVGDIVVAGAGEPIAVDGTVIDGTADVDEAVITGEARTVTKEIGSPVFAGARVVSGTLDVRAGRVGDRVAVARIAAAADAARSSRAPMAELADRIARVFVPAVIALALMTFIGWAVAATWSVAFTHALAVLVVACPCALGLATPTALAVAVARGTKVGVLFRDGAVLQRLANVNALAFDKTGTLTSATPRVRACIVRDLFDERMLLQWAASVEAGVEHPVAHAISQAAAERGLAPLAVSAQHITPGQGVSATLDGSTLFVGQPSFEELVWLRSVCHDVSSVAIVRKDATCVGAIVIEDALVPGAAQIVGDLRHHGYEISLLSGDRSEAVSPIATAVGITDARGGLSPTQKADALRELGKTRMVAMIGDGANDALALAQASVGIAVVGGAELAVAASDVSLRRFDALPPALGLARKTVRIMRQNLFWAFIYNVVTIPIAAGLIPAVAFSPMIASLAMSFSSVFVVGNSLRLTKARLV